MSDETIEDIRERKKEQLRESATEDAGGESPSEPVHVVGGDELEAVTGDSEVVLVDFYADWCGPCKMIEPVVETIASETPAAVAKVDVDQNQSLAAEFGVQGVPTLLLFADGEPVERLVGAQNEQALRQTVAQYT
jgi:thioredoxin 1